MSRSKPRSRHEILIIILLLVSVGLVALDRRGGLASNVRLLSGHVFAPSESWLKGFTLSLVGRGADATDAGRRGSDVGRLTEQLRVAESRIAQLLALIDDLKRQKQEIRHFAGGLPDYPLMLVQANVLSREYILPDGGLNIDAGTRRGVGDGHWVVYRYISQGKSAGVRKGQPVVTADGVVGLVEQAGTLVSQVRLVTSTQCCLPARIMHWDADDGKWVRQSETGQCQGTGDGKTMTLRHISRSTHVTPGDYVVTASAQTGMAEYLIIGEVTEVSYLPTDLTYTITVRPRLNLGALEQVYVLSPRGRPSR